MRIHPLLTNKIVNILIGKLTLQTLAEGVPPVPTSCLAAVVDKEYCYAKKVGKKNAFLSRFTKFSHLTSVRNIHWTKTAISEGCLL